MRNTSALSRRSNFIDVILGHSKERADFSLSNQAKACKVTVKSPIDGLITFQDIGVGEQSGDKKPVAITDTSQLIAELNVYPEDQNKKLLVSHRYTSSGSR